MKLTIGITTRNRPQALERCLRSLGVLAHVASRAVVFDDASDDPVAPLVRTWTQSAIDVHVIRDDRAIGYIAGRNILVAQADTPYVLLLDDDAIVFGAEAIERGIATLDADPEVVAIAFAQGEADGRPWPKAMQAGPASTAAYVPAFIGFAHLLRRDAFLQLGGYRESLVFYGEEKDFCIRALDAGRRVVYLPDAIVGHVPDAGGRSATRYVRFVIRNDCLCSLYNEPWPLVLVGLPVRLWRYRRMAGPHAEAGGLLWILRQLAAAAWDIRRHRRSVSWTTVRRWRQLARTVVPYEPPAGEARTA